MACHAVQRAPSDAAHSGLHSSFKCKRSCRTDLKWQLSRCRQHVKREALAPCMLDSRHRTRLTRCKQDTDHKQDVIWCRAIDKVLAIYICIYSVSGVNLSHWLYKSRSQQQEPDQLLVKPKQQVVPPVATVYLTTDHTHMNEPLH